MKKYIILLLLNLVYSEIFEGYTILTNLGGAPNIDYKTRLINNDFELINIWDHPSAPYSIGYLSPDSILTIGYKAINSEGEPPKIVKLNWNGEVLWQAFIPDDFLQPHHDIEPLDNGNILLLGWETKSIEEATQAGKIGATDVFKPDKIVEIRPIDSNDYEIIWEWHAWDHLIQDINPDLDNYGIISDNPQLADINLVEIGPGSGDWMHTNAISYNSYLDQIMISVRHLCELWIIDHSTTTEEAASHSGGNSGLGGDIIYRWGNPSNYNRGTESDRILDAPHGTVWIPNSYPSTGNILIFNNRHNPGDSAVLEINPDFDQDSNSYTIGENLPYGPDEPSWIYQNNFYSLNQSGAFRLPNGNTIITVVTGDRIFEIDENGLLVWEYYYTDGGFIPRAMKYGMDYFSNSLIGDINQDSVIDVLDIIYVVNFIMGTTTPTLEQESTSDINQDGAIDVLDVLLIINIIIR